MAPKVAPALSLALPLTPASPTRAHPFHGCALQMHPGQPWLAYHFGVTQAGENGREQGRNPAIGSVPELRITY